MMRTEHVSRDSRDDELEKAATREYPAVLVGDRIDRRFEVLQHIGAGGMADVYKGWDELLCRDVAIKVLKRERVSDIMRRRVLREARASCAVDHPHMVRVTGLGVVHDAPYLVMDLLHGVNLAEHLRQLPGERLDWRRAIELMLPVMEALHLAHEAGVVHRDLKPGNLFLHRRGDAEVLIILDLGLVKFTDADGVGARWTQSGIILGTVAYMSPEQAGSGPIDRRTDVYSLGVTLYRVLTGKHVFPFITGDGPITALTYHLYETAPRLSASEFPSALVKALETALMKEPDDRHPTMAAFAGALRACLGERPQARDRRRVWPFAARVGHVGLGAALALGIQRISAPDAVAPADATPAGAAEVFVVAPSIEADDDARGLCDPPESSEIDEASVCEGEDPAVAGRARQDARRRGPAVAASPVLAPESPVSWDPLAPLTADIWRCVVGHGDPDKESMRVQVSVQADGSVASAGILGDVDSTFLAECVQRRLLRLRFPVGEAGKREHIYTFAEAR